MNEVNSLSPPPSPLPPHILSPLNSLLKPKWTPIIHPIQLDKIKKMKQKSIHPSKKKKGNEIKKMKQKWINQFIFEKQKIWINNSHNLMELQGARWGSKMAAYRSISPCASPMKFKPSMNDCVDIWDAAIRANILKKPLPLNYVTTFIIESSYHCFANERIECFRLASARSQIKNKQNKTKQKKKDFP